MTDSYAFPAHGNSDIWTEERLLVVDTRGPWNRELVLRSHRLVMELAEKFGGKPWMALGIISGDGLHTPDAYEEMIVALRAQRAVGRCGTALVLKDVGIDGFFRNVFARLYSAAGEPVEFFKDEKSARRWLVEKVEQLP